MDSLNVDIAQILPDVVDAFSFVYGSEYREHITKQLQNSIYFFYQDVEGLEEYLKYLRYCKKNELKIRFLEEIGVPVFEEDQKHYAKKLPEEINQMIKTLIYSFSSEPISSLVPIKAFFENDSNIQNQFKVIRYLLKDASMTEENLLAFSKTEKYQELLKEIKSYNQIYDKLSLEYQEWEQTVKPYEQYVEDEKNRKQALFRKKIQEIYFSIIDDLPTKLKNHLLKMPIQDQVAILGNGDITKAFMLENFEESKMKQLLFSKESSKVQTSIALSHLMYFEKLGFIKLNMMDAENIQKHIQSYLSFLKQNDGNLKEWIPSQKVIQLMQTKRQIKQEEAIDEYYKTREDYLNFKKCVCDEPKILDFALQAMKNKTVCVLSVFNFPEIEKPIMFYTIRKLSEGYLAYNFLHECGHLIDQDANGNGFEPVIEPENPYDECFRKYEKFNEAVNDLFTEEAIHYLHEKGCYIIERKEITFVNTKNYNTFDATKKILKPLLQDFREQVIKAKVYANPEELIHCIGKENYEELVDVVNNVDSFFRNSFLDQMISSANDFKEFLYQQQVDRANIIYKNIKKHYEQVCQDEQKLLRKKKERIRF